jgi:DNA-directed RNA polymerase subunit M/transcription elongation factor TFIIS
MAKISCEVCGSHKIIKQDEVFICQKCGTRYSLQDVRQQYKTLKAQTAADAQNQPAKPASTKKATPAATETQPAQPSTPKAASNQSSWLARNSKLLIACSSAVLVIAVSLVIWLVLSSRNNNVITLQNYDSYVASTQSYHHDVQVPTNYELWEDFKIYFEDY